MFWRHESSSPEIVLLAGLPFIGAVIALTLIGLQNQHEIPLHAASFAAKAVDIACIDLKTE